MEILCKLGQSENSGVLILSVTDSVLGDPGQVVLWLVIFVCQDGLKIASGAASPARAEQIPCGMLTVSLIRLNHPAQTSLLLIWVDTAVDRYLPAGPEAGLGFRTRHESTYAVPEDKVDGPTVITRVPELRVQLPVLLTNGVQLPESSTLELSGVCVPINPEIDILVLLRSVIFVANVTVRIFSLHG